MQDCCLSVILIFHGKSVIENARRKKTVKVDKACFRGRSYEDFQNHLAADPDVPVVEMDSVIGSQGGKVLLTILFQDQQSDACISQGCKYRKVSF